MTVSDIDEMFRALIVRFGRDEVQRRLELLIENADFESKDALTNALRHKRPKSRSKAKNAIEHVESMNLPNRRKEKLRELARRFEEKSFLPTTSDIKNLFYTQGVDTSSVKTRQASVPRIFFFLSSLPEERLVAIMDDSSFSGPSRLGPLASAIKVRGSSRRRRKESLKSTEDNGTESPDRAKGR